MDQNEVDALALVKRLEQELETLKKAQAKASHKKPRKKQAKKKYKRKVKAELTYQLPSKEEEVQSLERQAKEAPVLDIKRGRGPAEFKGNLFVDNGKMCETDKIFNKKYGDRFNAQERQREGAKEVTMVCSMCKRPFQVISSQLISDYFVCVKCCGGK